MELWYYPLILVVGVFVGFINTLAGGGSLLTLPLLIFLGLPPIAANGTNRIGIIFQTLSGTLSFHHKGIRFIKFSLILAIPCVIGAYFGSQFAIDMNPIYFNKVLAVIMVLVLGIIVFKPFKNLTNKNDTEFQWKSTKGIICFVIFLGVGWYGGFIQAGTGFLFIAALTSLTNFDLVKINAIKVLVNMIFNVVAFCSFYLTGQIDLGIGMALAGGTIIGGWVAAHYAVERGEAWVQRILIVAVVLFSGVLMFK